MAVFDLHVLYMCCHNFCQICQIWKYSLYYLNNAIETLSVRVMIGCVTSSDINYACYITTCYAVNCIQANYGAMLNICCFVQHKN